MKKNFILLGVIIFCFAITSCQKEIDDFIGNNPRNTIPGVGGGTTANVGDLTGTWKFLNLHAKTLVSVEVNASGVNFKTITNSEYTSENNVGTVVISAQNIAYNNISYAINTRAYVKLYSGGILLDTLSTAFNMAVPAISYTAAYTRVNADSLYFSGGNAFMYNGISQTPPPGGMKLRREQDKLYLIQSFDETKTTTEQGQTSTSIQQATVTVALQKQ